MNIVVSVIMYKSTIWHVNNEDELCRLQYNVISDWIGPRVVFLIRYLVALTGNIKLPRGNRKLVS